MNRSHFAKMLPAIALLFALPAWAADPSEQANKNGTTVSNPTSSEAATSAQGDVGTPSDAQSNGKKQPQGRTNTPQGNAKQKPHGPTAIMDRATPAEKSNDSDATTKHPPTSQMDRSTPDQKSPSSKSDTDAQGQQGVK